MKIKVLCITLLLLAIFSHGQRSQFFEAKYDIYFNTDLPQKRQSELKIDLANMHSIFLVEKNDGENVNKLTKSNGQADYVVQYPDADTFIEMNFKKSTIYFKEMYKGQIYYVKDTILDIDWNTNYDEEKLIGKVLCKKATARFRGRNYIAWYSVAIPIPFGPYKFHGLPGLIVSIRDESNTFSWILTYYRTSQNKPIFKYNDDLTPLISAKKYYSELRYGTDVNRRKIIQSKLPKGIRLVSVETDNNVRKGIEIDFEWEQNTPKDKKE